MGDETKILTELKEFCKNIDWLDERLEKLRKEYPNQYVAVKNFTVADYDSNLQNLLRRLKEKGLNPSEIPIEFISKEPLRLIL